MLSDLNTASPNDPDDDAADSAPPEHRPSTAFLLIDAMLDKALVPAVYRRLLRAGTSATILVPDPSWVGKMITSVKARFANAHVRAIYERPKRPADAIDLERPFSAGQTTIVITPDLTFVPAPICATCDLIIRLDGPDARQVRRAIRAVTGQVARGLTQGDVAGKSLDELIASIRPNSSAADCVARLKPRPEVTQLVSGPDLATLPLFGDAKTWSDEIAVSARRLLAGEIAAKDVEATLLYGPPGTGKTVLAAAVARSAGMGFVQTSAAEWFVQSDGNLGGVLKSIDSFFQSLATAAPAVGFIDELDALPDRAVIDAGRREWWQSVVTGMLLMVARALSGPRKIILIAATNHPNHIDAALMRPGRFGRHVHVRAAQNEAEIAAVLSYHLAGGLDDASIAEIAAVAGLPTVAEVEAWVRAARTMAFNAGRSLIASDILEQIAPRDARSDDDLRLVALHEAGHAVAVVALGFQLIRVTIAGSETIGGMTSWRGADIATLKVIEKQVIVKLAGRAADIELGAGANDGASTDLENATRLLVSAEATYGLRSSLVSRPGDVHQLLAVDRPMLVRIEQHLDRLMTDTLALIRSRRAEVLAVADALLARRVLSGDAVRKIIAEVASAHPYPLVAADPTDVAVDGVGDMPSPLKP